MKGEDTPNYLLKNDAPSENHWASNEKDLLYVTLESLNLACQVHGEY
jgi:hypothetical protein